jgi:hypothetical protein
MARQIGRIGVDAQFSSFAGCHGLAQSLELRIQYGVQDPERVSPLDDALCTLSIE